MPITFVMNHDGGYLEIKYKGQISDSEVLSAYKSHFDSDNAIPVSNGLTDLSEADLTNFSSDAIRKLADYIIRLYNKTDNTSLKTAIYAPDLFQFGLSRMYQALSYETPQDIEIFKDREKAIQWLRTSQ
jgi:hypothetical protein